MNKELRRQMKKEAKRILKKHYFLLLILCAILIFFGTEFNYSGSSVTADSNEGQDIIHDVAEDISSDLGLGDKAGGVLGKALQGDYDAGEKEADEEIQNLQSNKDGVLSRSNGIISSVLNNLSSGKIFVSLGKALRNAFHSDTAASVFLIIISFAIYFFIYTFIRSFYSAVIRRTFLESVNYDRTPVSSIGHILGTGKWAKVSLTLLLKEFYLALWNITIIGGIIKSFSYAMVPYIVAENPDIGYNKAITLSRKMMKGHKWEFFVFMLTFLPWHILSFFTMGFSDIFFGVPYRLGAYTEYYIWRRDRAKEENIENADLLNDNYLYVKADEETLKTAYADTLSYREYLESHPDNLTKTQRFFSKWFGIWLGTMKHKRDYDKIESNRYMLQKNETELNGEAYPYRLNNFYTKKNIKKEADVYFMRTYPIWTIIFMFFLFAFIGWCWEVLYNYINFGEFANRGTLFGPWLPIYGFGGVIAIVFCARFRKKPALTLVISVILCGCIEYFAHWFLEMKYGMLWWDYTGNFLNLHGRICAEGLIAFGIGCMLAVYIVGPLLDMLVSKAKTPVIVTIAVILLGLFGVDVVTHIGKPNTGNNIGWKKETAVTETVENNS